jgi:hypothetical protein
MRGYFALLVISFVLVVSYAFLQSILFTILAFFVVTTPIMTFLFPAYYSFREDGFSRKQLWGVKELSYADYISHKILEDGVILIKKRHKYDFIYLFDDAKKEELSSFILQRGVIRGE